MQGPASSSAIVSGTGACYFVDRAYGVLARGAAAGPPVPVAVTPPPDVAAVVGSPSVASVPTSLGSAAVGGPSGGSSASQASARSPLSPPGEGGIHARRCGRSHAEDQGCRPWAHLHRRFSSFWARACPTSSTGAADTARSFFPPSPSSPSRAPSLCSPSIARRRWVRSFAAVVSCPAPAPMSTAPPRQPGPCWSPRVGSSAVTSSARAAAGSSGGAAASLGRCGGPFCAGWRPLPGTPGGDVPVPASPAAISPVRAAGVFAASVDAVWAVPAPAVAGTSVPSLPTAASPSSGGCGWAGGHLVQRGRRRVDHRCRRFRFRSRFCLSRGIRRSSSRLLCSLRSCPRGRSRGW